jgi:hypothetical protein
VSIPQRHKWIDDGDGNCEVCGGSSRPTAVDVVLDWMDSEATGTKRGDACQLVVALAAVGMLTEDAL